MPIYEYRRPDGTTFELLQSFRDEPLRTDPETGVPVERVLHAPAVHFKGSGFYNTDYGTRKRQRENQSDASSSSAAASSEKTQAKDKGDAAKADTAKADTAAAAKGDGASAKKAEPAAAA
jgi:putative FmdB family regulatory protein